MDIFLIAPMLIFYFSTKTLKNVFVGIGKKLLALLKNTKGNINKSALCGAMGQIW